jgi:Zn-dependent oligopeptidase
MKRLIAVAVCASAIFLPTMASAGEVYRREVNQEQRIYNGVRNSSITPAELRNLERREAAVDATRRRYIHSGRGLTVRERRQLNRREKNISRTIYRYKHN